MLLLQIVFWDFDMKPGQSQKEKEKGNPEIGTSSNIWKGRRTEDQKKNIFL